MTFLDLLVQAIISWIRSQEKTWRYVMSANPGNLWDGYSKRRWPAIPIDRHGYLKPRRPHIDAARAALHGYVALRIRRGYTLRRLILHWPKRSCPPTKAFLDHVTVMMGMIPQSVRLSVLQLAFERQRRRLQSGAAAVAGSKRGYSSSGKPAAPKVRPGAASRSPGTAPDPTRTGSKTPRQPTRRAARRAKPA